MKRGTGINKEERWIADYRTIDVAVWREQEGGAAVQSVRCWEAATDSGSASVGAALCETRCCLSGGCLFDDRKR